MAWHFEFLRGSIDAWSMRWAKQASKAARFFYIRGVDNGDSWDEMKGRAK